ncbi:MAG: glycosyltransferase [Candidatus Paceibacterota bacterium]|jgi:cellulose synthase/poly-beta-1,6-N-acetylglucosamine synthase-like glycosyltransferase
MSEFLIVVTNILLFITLYAQVLLLFTFFEKKSVFANTGGDSYAPLKRYPIVTIIVPVFNEEKTLAGTILSLLSLDYPKDKLDILVVDDGSTDHTRQVANSFKSHPQVRVFSKTNGGKHTAVNLGISHANGEFIGCLDADSFVDKDALSRIIRCFEDEKVMAVTPAIKVHTPENILQEMQSVEYNMGIFLRKVYGSMNAIHVAPGPFSIFRKEVFDKLGGYVKAHNTEDMEFAMRMHKNHYPIANVYDSYVYTVTPKTVRGLYKQRLRWVYGFLENAKDYRVMIFNKKYGNLGMFTLPAAIISIFAALFFTGLAIARFVAGMARRIMEIQAVGMPLRFEWPHFNWFFVNTSETAVVVYALSLSTLFVILVGKKLSEGNMKPHINMFYFFLFYGIIAPAWLFKAVYNVAFNKKTTWR